MDIINNYKDLKVWQKSMDLAFMVYRLVKILPREELYSLSDQMRRAVVSIPSNIAEGCQRGSIKEYIHFLYIAKGSLAELETQLLLCKGFGYINREQTDPIEAQCMEVTKMLNMLINNLQQKINKGDTK
ncbi:MAG: four helix bundle protein [Anaerolineaceae bacterium]|nr:four helix bundle protein [Anaerolineaceae bacterium]